MLSGVRFCKIKTKGHLDLWSVYPKTQNLEVCGDILLVKQTGMILGDFNLAKHHLEDFIITQLGADLGSLYPKPQNLRSWINYLRVGPSLKVTFLTGFFLQTFIMTISR